MSDERHLSAFLPGKRSRLFVVHPFFFFFCPLQLFFLHEQVCSCSLRFFQALADGTTAIRLGRGRNGAVVQGTAGEAAADRYRLRGSFAGRKKSNDHAGGAQS